MYTHGEADHVQSSKRGRVEHVATAKTAGMPPIGAHRRSTVGAPGRTDRQKFESWWLVQLAVDALGPAPARRTSTMHLLHAV